MFDREPIDREFLLRELRTLLSAPVREEKQLSGSIVMIGGQPGEVIVQVCGGKVSVSVFSLRWEGPHTSVVRPKHIATLNWRRIPASTLIMTLHGLIKAACEFRWAKYRRCERCKEINPPEWMHDEKTCDSCAQQHLGIVH